MVRAVSILICFLASFQCLQADYRVLAFGDSNTWGWKPMGSGLRFADKDRWTGVLEKHLGTGYTVISNGLVARRTDIDGLDTHLVAGSFLNGANTLPPAIVRNAPLDLVILFLGTNDLQAGAERSADEIAEAVAGLVKLGKSSRRLLYSAYESPEIWVVVPAPLGDLTASPLKGLFAVGRAESAKLSASFAAVAKRDGFRLFDCSAICIDGIGADGVHLNQSSHAALGKAIADQILAE